MVEKATAVSAVIGVSRKSSRPESRPSSLPSQAKAVLQEIASAFIEAGTLEALDTSCVDTIGPAPFFKTLLGPDP